MKVRLTIEVDAHARYIIAKYFRPVDAKLRTRATRKQVVRFCQAALRSAVAEQAGELDLYSQAIARRLREPKSPGNTEEEIELLRPPKEKQRSLLW